MEFEEWIGLLFFAGLLLYAFYSGLVENKKRRIFEQKQAAENKQIQEILGGFDVHVERQRIVQLLKEELPIGYRCGKKGCSGIILKSSSGSHYYCSVCHNIRSTVRILKHGLH